MGGGGGTKNSAGGGAIWDRLMLNHGLKIKNSSHILGEGATTPSCAPVHNFNTASLHIRVPNQDTYTCI